MSTHYATNHDFDAYIAATGPDVAFADELYAAMEKAGATIWFPQRRQRIGDDTFDLLNEGLKRARYVIVFLSPVYLKDRAAMNGLHAWLQQDTNRQAVLPILHGLSEDQFMEALPIIAGRKPGNTEMGLEQLTTMLMEVLTPPRDNATPAPVPWWKRIFRTTAQLTHESKGSRFPFWWIGLALVLIAIVLVFFFRCPTEPQYNMLRIVIALACGMLSAGMFRKIGFGGAGWVAGFVFACTFLIVYLVNVPDWVVREDCGASRYLSGTVWVDGESQQGVEVIVHPWGFTGSTNTGGKFVIPAEWPVNDSLQLRFTFQNLDTAFWVGPSDPFHNIELFLSGRCSEPTESELRTLVQNRMAEFEAELELELKAKQSEVGSKRTSDAAAQELFSAFYQRHSGGFNTYEFRNGWGPRTTHKTNVKALGIPTYSSPTNAFGYHNPEIWQQGQLVRNKEQLEFELAYLNTDSVTFDILRLEHDNDCRWHALIDYHNPIRATIITAIFGPNTKYTAHRNFDYRGFKPTETFVIDRVNETWFLADIQ